MPKAESRICSFVILAALLVLFAAGGASASEVSLVAYYSFDNSGAMGTDDSGNGSTLQNNKGTVPTYTSAGKVAGAAVFNGTSNGYDRDLDDTNPKIYPNGAFTVTTWAKPAVVAAYCVSRPSASNKGGFAFVTAGDPNITWRTTLYYTGGNNQVDSGVVLTAGSWDHIAFSYAPDGPADVNAVYTGTGKIYVNGTLANTNTSMRYSQNGGRFGVGFRANNSSWFNGTVDEFAVFEGLLSAGDIAALYAGEITPLTVEPLVGDINGDDIVNFVDFALLASNWLKVD